MVPFPYSLPYNMFGRSEKKKRIRKMRKPHGMAVKICERAFKFLENIANTHSRQLFIVNIAIFCRVKRKDER